MTNKEFSTFYKTYCEFSRKIAKRLLQDENVVEDICQEVFTAIYNMGEQLDMSNEKKIRGLLTTVTYNKVKDYWRKAYKKYEYCTEDIIVEQYLGGTKSETEDIILGMEAREHVKFVFQKLREENEINYEIFVRVKIFGISPAFVAQQYDTTVSGVHNRNMRTKRWLKKEYQKIARG